MLEPLPLWPDPELSKVTLRLMPTKLPSATAVLVLPGGGYAHLADHEAEPVAQKFVDAGINAAVLRYRLATQGGRHPGMIHDALRAIRLLRVHGWEKVAILGFSAGGHLASTAAVHYDTFGGFEGDDLVGKHSARPDAAVLCYPVIDLAGNFAHKGSAQNLLGPDATAAQLQALSNANHVTASTPPTFLWHTNQDAGVPPENSISFALACRKHRVPVELHVYEEGGHGVGLADGDKGKPDLPRVAGWIDLAIAFVQRHLNQAKETV